VPQVIWPPLAQTFEGQQHAEPTPPLFVKPFALHSPPPSSAKSLYRYAPLSERLPPSSAPPSPQHPRRRHRLAVIARGSRLTSDLLRRRSARRPRLQYGSALPTDIIFNTAGTAIGNKLLQIRVDDRYADVAGQLRSAGYAQVTYNDRQCTVNFAAVAYVCDVDKREDEPLIASM
jgi:hypothetical protein